MTSGPPGVACGPAFRRRAGKEGRRMPWLVLTHVLAGALALLVGARLGAMTQRSRRKAMRWAYDAARAEAETAKQRESLVRIELEDLWKREAQVRTELEEARRREAQVQPAHAELEEARKRESAAQEQADDARALAATLEGELTAARWERDELYQVAREAQKELEARSEGIAILHTALVDAVRRAAVWEARAQRASATAEVIRLGGESNEGAWGVPHVAAPAGPRAMAG
jgi:DNA repair exonuclease SbcCD ATPase subunit